MPELELYHYVFSILSFLYICFLTGVLPNIDENRWKIIKNINILIVCIMFLLLVLSICYLFIFFIMLGQHIYLSI